MDRSEKKKLFPDDHAVHQKAPKAPAKEDK